MDLRRTWTAHLWTHPTHIRQVYLSLEGRVEPVLSLSLSLSLSFYEVLQVTSQSTDVRENALGPYGMHSYLTQCFY
jgi:hypothetical protein